jgi:hypothetical protein
MRFDLLKLGRVLRDVDEKDAGGGSSVDPLDIFSMDFEGDSNRDEAEKTSSQGGETSTTEGDVNPQTDGNVEQGTEASESSNNLEKTQEAAPAEDGKQNEEVSTDPQGAKISSPSSSPSSVPSSDALLADAMKVITALSQQKKSEEPAEAVKGKPAEEDADAVVFKKKEFSDYSFNISPKLYNALFGSEVADEERMMALQGFASGIATTVHNNIMESLGSWTKRQFNAVPRVVNYLVEQREASRATTKSLRDDFYGAFPELNKPELSPIIRATIQSIQKETGAKVWTPQMRNLVGERVKKVLSAYAQANAPVAPAPKTVPASVTPPATKPQNLDPNSPEAIFDIMYSEF